MHARSILGVAVVGLAVVFGALPAAGQEGYITTRFDRRVVDLEQLSRLLARVGAELPLAVSGEVAVEGSLGYPRGALLSPRLYRIEATLASERIVIEGLELHQVRANLLYQDGVARLRELSFLVPHGNAPPGQIAGSAALPLSPAGDLVTDLRVTGLPIERVLALFPGLEEFAAGLLSGAVRGQVAPDRLTDVTAWRLSGNVSLAGAELQGLPPLDATAQFQASGGALTVTRLQGTMRTARFSGTGRMVLTAPYDFSAEVRAEDDQLAWLGDLPEELRPPFPVEGAARVSGRARGQLDPWRWRVDGDVAAQRLDFGEPELASLAGDFTARSAIDPLAPPGDAPQKPENASPWVIGGTFRVGGLRVAGVSVDAVETTLALDHVELNASRLAATLYNGAAHGAVRFPLTGMGDTELNLRLQGVDLGRLLADLNVLEFPVRARAEGVIDMAIPADDPDDVARWRGDGNLALADVSAFGWMAATVGADFRLAENTLALSRLAVDQGPMSLRLAGSVGLQNPHAYTVRGEGLRLNLSDLRSLPENLRPPVAVEGLANFNVAGSGQLAPFTFVGSGTVGALALRVDRIAAHSVSLAFTADEQQWRLSNLAANLYGGSIRGSAEIPKADAGDLHLALRLQGIDLGRWLDDLDVLDFPLGAEAEGMVDLVLPRDDPNDITRWSGVGRLSLDDLAAFDWTAAAARAEFQLNRGRLFLSEATALQDAARLRLAGSVDLQAPHTFAIWADSSQFDLAQLNALPPDLRPPVTLAGVAALQIEGNGQLRPFSFVGRGAGSAAALQVDEAFAQSVQFAFDVSEQQFEVTRLDAALYGGQVRGAGVWPRQDAASARVAVEWQDVNLGQLLDAALELPVRLDGISDGQMNLTAPPGGADDLRQWRGAADISADEIRINDVLAGQFTAHAERQADTLAYRLDAAMLEGRLSASGQLPMTEMAEARGAGTLTLTNLRFSRVAAMLRGRMEDRGLDGLLDLHADFTHDRENFAPTGSGAFALRSVELSGFTQIDRLQGRVLFTPEFVRLENVSGGLSGGRIQATALYRLDERPRGEFQLSLRGAEAEQFLGIFLGDDLPLAGRLDLSLRGRLSDALRATGNASISRAEAVALSLGTVRSPVNLEIGLTSGRGRLALHGMGASLAGGRMSGNLDVGWGYGVDLDTDVRFDNVDLPRVLEEFGAGGDWAAGKLTGSLALKGRNMRSANDLTGSFQARLRNVQAMKLPVLSALQPYTGSVSVNKAFREGEARATLARGVVRIQELTLVSDAAQIYVDGTITLAGRLNLQAIVNTGQFQAAGLAAERLVQALALSVAPPAGLLAEASEFLSNRVIYLRIGGTIARPYPRVQPLPILRDEVLRFFFRQLTP